MPGILAVRPRSRVASRRVQAVEDKTFGMKNKKGAKGQKYVNQVKQSIDASASKGAGCAAVLAGVYARQALPEPCTSILQPRRHSSWPHA